MPKKGQKMKRAKKAKPEYEIDVSNLIPEFSCRIKTTYRTPYGRDLLNILKEKPTEKATTGERSQICTEKNWQATPQFSGHFIQGETIQ